MTGQRTGVAVALKVRVVQGRSFSRTVFLEGRLNNETVGTLDAELKKIVDSPTAVVVFDLADLEYISSAGLRSIFGIQKTMAARGGRALLLSPTPQVQKVLEIVNAADLAAVFTSVEELDRYLDDIQRRIVEGG
jgi:anti-anti-sigma factor